MVGGAAEKAVFTVAGYTAAVMDGECMELSDV
jgi:hypothetical protein